MSEMPPPPSPPPPPPPLDLELRLGLPGMAGRSDDTKQPATAAKAAPVPDLRPLLSLPPFDVELNLAVSGFEGAGNPKPDQETGEEETAVEPRCKREKLEPSSSAVASTREPVAMVMQPPSSPPAAPVQRHDVIRGAREGTANQQLPALVQGYAGATEPAWIRSELLRRHDFPADLALHFLEDKILQDSDVESQQSRLLVRSAALKCLSALLSADELEACDLDGTGRRRKRPATPKGETKKRAAPKKYPGVPVLIHARDVERAPAELRLTTFYSTGAMVVNGRGYGEIVESSGLKVKDRVEVWAFQRPEDQRLCLVMAKRDEDRRPAIDWRE